jgi:hypothetical protein
MLCPDAKPENLGACTLAPLLVALRFLERHLVRGQAGTDGDAGCG